MAEYVAWKPFYSVGDPSIDAEHKQIIGMINELYSAVVAHETDVDLKRIADRLCKYTIEHFTHEEELMREWGFPDMDAHRLLHDRLKRRTQDIRNSLSAVTGRDMLAFLKEWWCNHIQDEDKAYAPYLHAMAH
jgi:hemerythrin